MPVRETENGVDWEKSDKTFVILIQLFNSVKRYHDREHELNPNQRVLLITVHGNGNHIEVFNDSFQ